MSSDVPRRTLRGLVTARGFACGPAYVMRGGGAIPIPEYVIEQGREDDETQRFRRALNATRRDLDALVAALRERTGRKDVQVFECHLMMLEDDMLIGAIEREILGSHLNAEAAVRKAMGSARAKFAQMNDAYFRERVRDLDDIERRLEAALVGFVDKPEFDLKSPAVILAEDLTPSETMRLPREFVLGFAIAGGSPTCHAALLARAMGIPAVTGLGDQLTAVVPGETVLLNGNDGTLCLGAGRSEVLEFRDLIERDKELSEEAVAGLPAGTLRGGGDVPILANVHPGVPLDGLARCGARGIGLYRSEYLWLGRELEPTEDEQFAAYRFAAETVKGLGSDSRVTIRTLDVGGDKTISGITAHETNPFLGNRSIRYLLANPHVFRTQLRAILRASAFGPVSIMYPMVSCLEEIDGATAVLAQAKRTLDAEGASYDPNVPVGIMVEVPAAALNAAALARKVDFFSIGTNDLVQYTMAADRGNQAVAYLNQPMNPAVVSLVRMAVSAAHEVGIKVSVCGESASDPVVGLLWVSMGVDAVSMNATYIPQLAKLLSRLTRDDLDAYRAVATADTSMTAHDLTDMCAAWLRARIPDFDNIVL